MAALDASDAFAALEGDILAMRDVIETVDPSEAEGQVNDLAKRFGDVEGADDVEDWLKDARRALRAREPDPEKAIEAYEEALQAFESQKQWRAEAVTSIKPGLEAYIDAITDTLGARQQQRLSRDQALYIAALRRGASGSLLELLEPIPKRSFHLIGMRSSGMTTTKDSRQHLPEYSRIPSPLMLAEGTK